MLHQLPRRETVYQKSSTTLPFLPPPCASACRSYISATCGGSQYCTTAMSRDILTCSQPVASSAFLSSRIRMKRGKRSDIPRSSTCECQRQRASTDARLTNPIAAVYTGLRLKSAVSTSQTTFGSNHISGFAPPTLMSPRGFSISRGFSTL